MPGKSLAVEGGSKLHELEGRTEVTPSRRLEVIGRLGAIGCRGASWSEQLDGNFAERIPVFWTSQIFMASIPFFTVWYADFKAYSSTVVTAIVPHTTL